MNKQSLPIKSLYLKNDSQTGTTLYFEDKFYAVPFTGYVIEHYPNGKIMWEAEIKEGKQNGPEKHYFENGSLQELNDMTNNAINGIAKEFYDTGKLKTESIVIMNEFLKSIFYDEEGNIIRKEEKNHDNITQQTKKKIPEFMDLKLGNGEGLEIPI